MRHVYLTGPTTTVSGITVFLPGADVGDAAQGETAMARVSEALSLIRRYDPRRFARIVHDGVRIVFSRHLAHAQYWSPVNVIALNLPSVMRWTAPQTATAIVHEATHARLSRAGIAPSRAAIARIERRCVEEEISFVRRLPHTDEAFEQWAEQKRGLLVTKWWTRRGKARRRVALLEREGGPAWLLWLARRLS
jgi:hypothetical protein